MARDSALAAIAADHARLTAPSHVGVLVPWANTITEYELPRMGLDRVVFHYARLVPNRRYRDTDSFLAEIAAAVPATNSQLARLGLACTLVGCTSVGFTTPNAYAGTPVVDAFRAIIVALQRLAASRVVLATPYLNRHTAREAEALAAQGVRVQTQASLNLGLLDDYAAVTTDRIRGLLAEMPHESLAGAQALVLSCTAWPTLAAIGELEAEFAMPVLSSNLALAWYAVCSALDAAPHGGAPI